MKLKLPVSDVARNWVGRNMSNRMGIAISYERIRQ